MSTLAAAYTFNDGTGNIYDYSGNKVTLTPTAGSMTVSPTISPTGVGYDCLLNQNATGSFGPIGSFAGLTVFCYFQFNGGIGLIASYANVFKLAVNSSGKVVWQVYDTGATLYTATSSTVLSSGTWYTITGTWDATAKQIYVYINGAQVALNDMPNPISNTTSSLEIGPVGTLTTSLLNVLEIRDQAFSLTQISQLESSPGGVYYNGTNSFAVGDVIADENQVDQAIVTWVSDLSGFYAYPVTTYAAGEYSRYGNIYNTNRQYVMLFNNDFDGNGNGQISVLYPIACFADYFSPANIQSIDYTGIKAQALRYQDGNQASGKILTSDSTGNATWQTNAGGGGTVTSITAGAGLAGGTITSSGTISLILGVCTPGTYQSVTVDTYGRVTAGSTLTNNYQTVQYNASSLTQRAKLNFIKDFNVTDDSGNGSTDIRLRGKSKLYQFYNY
ncbi:MAG TPA: LamG-like jellyroll fold domain-containing protein [Bacteroidia bacterium]|jgi:hypothetical protein|nr:LamG-like jellyroll fold domain-containing protein [Bacteroidia bacterium]